MKTHLRPNVRLPIAATLAAVCSLASPALKASATINIINGDSAGEGFNDPTPAAPVGGNTGTTVGQQRLIAFQYAANIWGASLDSTVPIEVLASFDPLTCTATSAVLGSAGAVSIWANFAGATAVDTWHSVALANKLFGSDLDPTQPDIRARFNSNLGQTGCLTGTGWYYGLDGNHGTQIDLVTVLLHELAHGLGFQQFADLATGVEFSGFTDVYGRNLLDLTAGKTWDLMTDAERVTSAVNSRRVVWQGANVTAEVPNVLALGTPVLQVTAPPSVAGFYDVGAAAFGPPLSSPGVSGVLVLADDGVAPSTDVCSPLAPNAAAAAAGKIVVVDRGTCAFTDKVKRAQDAGAIAVIVVDNVAGAPPGGLGGTDPSITIPAVRITLDDGSAIKAVMGRYDSRFDLNQSGCVDRADYSVLLAQIRARSSDVAYDLNGDGRVNIADARALVLNFSQAGGESCPAVQATLGVDLAIRAGADPLGRALIYTPNPRQPGSSVSHWDTSASPNQLMEPSINSDLTHEVDPPDDLTLPLLRDIGW